MKHHHLFALALAAALTAAPAFAQDADKPADSPKSHEAKPENGSMKAQEANQEKTDNKADKNDSKIPQSDREAGVKNEAGRMPQSDQEPAAQDRDRDKSERHEADHRQAKQPSDKDRNTHVTIKSDAKDKLRQHYAASHPNHSHTVTVVRQQALPVSVQTMIEPVPVEYVSYLGPAPEGFVYGFVDGYVVLYDPDTFFVVDVLPLW